jgi:hypothetical protein
MSRYEAEVVGLRISVVVPCSASKYQNVPFSESRNEINVDLGLRSHVALLSKAPNCPTLKRTDQWMQNAIRLKT